MTCRPALISRPIGPDCTKSVALADSEGEESSRTPPPSLIRSGQYAATFLFEAACKRDENNPKQTRNIQAKIWSTGWAKLKYPSRHYEFLCNQLPDFNKKA